MDTNGSVTEKDVEEILLLRNQFTLPPPPNDLTPEQRNIANQAREMVQNTLISRAQYVRQAMDSRVDVYREVGRPRPLMLDHYRVMYEETSVGGRVVEVYPRETWKVQPEVYEDEDVKVITAFEQDLMDAASSLMGGNSAYKPHAGGMLGVLNDYMCRLDEQAGVGSYGVMLLGIDDGKDLSEPAQFVPRSVIQAPERKLLYLRVFPEYMASIEDYDTNRTSPRYGQPTMYEVVLSAEPITGMIGRVVSGDTNLIPGETKKVHWTRMIHFADNCKTDDVRGIPRQHQVYTNLHALYKLYPGSGEMYWRGAFPGISFEAPAGTRRDDATATQDKLEAYMNGLQRYLDLVGYTAKSLAPQVEDPNPQIMAQIKAICVKMEVPLGVFMGDMETKGLGEQEDVDWNDRIKRRQSMTVTPRLVIQLIDRLIDLGIARRPKQYHVWWPPIVSKVERDKATIGVQKTVSLAQYMQHKIYKVMGPLDFLVRVIGMDELEARTIVDNNKELISQLVEELATEAKKSGGTVTWVDGTLQILAGMGTNAGGGGTTTGGANKPNSEAGTQDQTGRGSPTKDRPKGISGSNN